MILSICNDASKHSIPSFAAKVQPLLKSYTAFVMIQQHCLL
jgi:hypothetical protein